MMKKGILYISLFVFALPVFAQNKDSVYLFCYFKGNGDGLHYAYSNDGYVWQIQRNQKKNNAKMKKKSKHCQETILSPEMIEPENHFSQVNQYKQHCCCAK